MLEARTHVDAYVNMIPLMTCLHQRINLHVLGGFLIMCLMLVYGLCFVAEAHSAIFRVFPPNCGLVGRAVGMFTNTWCSHNSTTLWRLLKRTGLHFFNSTSQTHSTSKNALFNDLDTESQTEYAVDTPQSVLFSLFCRDLVRAH